MKAFSLTLAAAFLGFLATASMAEALTVGDRIQATANLNIRASASTNGSLLGTAASGAQGWITGGPTSANGYAWWRVDWDGHSTGWSISDYMVKVATASPGGFTLSHDPPVWDTRPPAGPAVQLRWGASSNATSYEVYRNGSKIYPASGTFSGLSFRNETNLTGGQTYSYHIIARNASGSRQSNTLSITMPNAPPAVPETPGYLEAQFFAERVELGWTDKSSNEQGFVVERRIGSGVWSQITSLGARNGGDVYWTDNSTNPKTTYSYRVRAYNAMGNSGYTNEVSGATPAGRPGNFALSHDAPAWDTSLPGPKVRLIWSASQDAGGYAIYRDGSLYVAGVSGTSFINQSGLNAGQTYTYHVRASNSEGTTDSNTITVTMPPAPASAPAAPANLTATPLAGGIQLQWSDQSGNETGFKIERRPSWAPGWVALATVGANAGGHLDTTAEALESYVYRVRAYNSIGPSNYCNEATATGAPPAAPGSFNLRHDAPYWDTKAPAGPAVMLRWDVAAGAASYEVYRDGARIFPGTGAPAHTGRTFLNQIGLTPGGTHHFYVVARNAGGTTASNTISIPMPSAPAGIPQIDSLTPDTVAGVPLPDRVQITVRGSHFQPGVQAIVSYTGRSHVLVDAQHVQRLDDRTVQVRIATSVEADTWSLYLKNPDQNASNTKTFQVTPPTGSVTLNQIHPNVTSPSTHPRTFTLAGSGFSPADHVKLTAGQSVSYVTAPNVEFIGHQTLRFTHAFTQSPASVSVRVVKASGTESEAVMLTVDQSQMSNLLVDPISIDVQQDTVMVGGIINVAFTVKNVGNGAAPPTTARFRLSKDAKLDKSDPGFDNMDVDIPRIEANSSYTHPGVHLLLPQTLLPGSYRIGLFVDALNQGNQSNTTDDGALDQEFLSVAEQHGASIPHFTEQPKSKNVFVNTGFHLSASASKAIRYDWYFNGELIQDPLKSNDGGRAFLHINGATAGNAGDYWAEAVGENGIRTRSVTANIQIIGESVSNPSIDKGQFSLWSLDHEAIRPDLPTVILTHGWQLFDKYDEFGPQGFRKMAEKIRAAISSTSPCNILLFSWESAHQSFPSHAAPYVQYAGLSLASELRRVLGAEYAQKMHFIGHSLGCFVSSFAIKYMSDFNYFPRLPTTKGSRIVQLTLLDPAFNIAIGPDSFVGWSACRLQEVLKEERLIAAVENYYATEGLGSGGPITNSGPGLNGTRLSGLELGSDDNKHSAVWSTWYQGTIGNSSYTREKGGFNNSIVLESSNTNSGWSWLARERRWEPEASCVPEPGFLKRISVDIVESIQRNGERAHDGFKLMLDSVSGSIEETQDLVQGVLSKTQDLILSPFQAEDPERKLFRKSLAKQGGRDLSSGELIIRSAIKLPRKSNNIRITGKRINEADQGVLAVLFGGELIQVVGLDYFPVSEFRELNVSLLRHRNRTGLLEMVLKGENGKGTHLRISSVEIDSEAETLAAPSDFAVIYPANRFRTTSTRIGCAAKWKGRVQLSNVVASVNNTSQIPLNVGRNGWEIELGGLQPGRNTIRFDARTEHGQVISVTREVWRVVKTPFNLAIEGQGTVKGGKMGGSTLEVGQELNLVAVPKRGYVFDRWEGAVASSSANTVLRVEPDMTLTAHFVPTPFAGKEGTYTAAIASEDPLLTGWMQLKLSSTGSFTGILMIGGQRLAITGGMDSSGRITLWLPLLQKELRARVTLEAELPTIEVSLLHAAEVVASSTPQRPGYDGRSRIAPQAGSYTIALEPPAEDSLPQGYGYGTVMVSKSGTVKLALRLPDQSSVSQSSVLGVDGRWPLFAQLYARKGWISGEIQHGDGVTTPEIAGEAVWVKPKTKGTYLPGDWMTNLGVIGSRYDKPTSGRMLFPGLAGGTTNLCSLTWGIGVLDVPLLIQGSLDERHRFVSGEAGVVLKFNAGNGLFSGTTLNPATAKPLRHAGVILQGQRMAYGAVRLAETTAPLQLHPQSSNTARVNISVQVVPAGSGAVTGHAAYAFGEAVRLTAVPAEGYAFMNWLENAAEIGVQPGLQFAATSDRTLTAQFVPVASSAFTDDFNRGNADEVGNGWLNSVSLVDKGWLDGGAIDGRLRVVNHRAENSQTRGTAAIYRGFDHSAGVRVRAVFSHVNGFGTLQKRYVHCLSARSNGQVGNGLAVMFYRADQGFDNSTVFLFDGSEEVAKLATDFQFGERIRTEVDFHPDGSVQVHVANADGSAGAQTLTFPARSVNAAGSNVMLVLTGCQGSLKSSVDDVEVESF